MRAQITGDNTLFMLRCAAVLGIYLALIALWLHAAWPYTLAAALVFGQLIRVGITLTCWPSASPRDKLIKWWKFGFAHAVWLLTTCYLLLRVAGRA